MCDIDACCPLAQIIKQIKQRMAENKTFYSFEYFPPKVREAHWQTGAELARMHACPPHLDLTLLSPSVFPFLVSIPRLARE